MITSRSRIGSYRLRSYWAPNMVLATRSTGVTLQVRSIERAAGISNWCTRAASPQKLRHSATPEVSTACTGPAPPPSTLTRSGRSDRSATVTERGPGRSSVSKVRASSTASVRPSTR